MCPVRVWVRIIAGSMSAHLDDDGIAVGLVVDELVNDMCCVLLFGLKYN